jgi:hypothetical protein
MPRWIPLALWMLCLVATARAELQPVSASVAGPKAGAADRRVALPEFPVMTPGSYYGLIHTQGKTRPSHATEGFLSGTLDETGVFTGRLQMDGLAQPIGAIFMSDGVAMFAGNVSWFAFGDRMLTLKMVKGGIKARVTRRGVASEGVAARAPQGEAAELENFWLGRNGERVYDIVLPSLAEILGGDRIAPADGATTGRLQVMRNGTVHLAGVLDDGTLVTCTSALLPGNRAPLYFEVPPRAGRAVGAFSGVLDFDTLRTAADSADTNVLYFHPAKRGK